MSTLRRLLKNPRILPAILSALFLLWGCARDSALDRYNKAEWLYGEGRYSEAEAEYAHVAKNFQLSPYAPKSQLRLASIYSLLKENKKARDAYYALCYTFPKSPEAALARKALARGYSEAGAHRDAIEEYQRAVELAPEEKERLQFLVAMEYLMMGDLKQTRAELSVLIKTTRDNNLLAEALYQTANAYYLEGDMKKALEAYDEVIARHGESRWALDAEFGRAKTLEDSGRLDEALKMFNALRISYPDKNAVALRISSIQKRLIGQ
ncbi:MAG: tetratricopeptide repeat protein [Deltaproteobacteria bacterium]|nr:tetratricopeptide repeat protein [Deltaproteobacteria bacterium]